MHSTAHLFGEAFCPELSSLGVTAVQSLHHFWLFTPSLEEVMEFLCINLLPAAELEGLDILHLKNTSKGQIILVGFLMIINLPCIPLKWQKHYFIATYCRKREFCVKKDRPYDLIHLLFAISNYLKHNVTLKCTLGVLHSCILFWQIVMMLFKVTFIKRVSFEAYCSFSGHNSFTHTSKLPAPAF